jgi:hypothetical protein
MPSARKPLATTNTLMNRWRLRKMAEVLSILLCRCLSGCDINLPESEHVSFFSFADYLNTDELRAGILETSSHLAVLPAYR